jgi:hypothetical protein
MHPSRVISCMLILGASSMVAAVDNLQLNFYTDRECSKFQGSLPGSWATPLSSPDSVSGINFNYGTSMNIAACAHKYCMCQFYTKENREGDIWHVILPQRPLFIHETDKTMIVGLRYGKGWELPPRFENVQVLLLFLLLASCLSVTLYQNGSYWKCYSYKWKFYLN